jgi:hypothetical protein
MRQGHKAREHQEFRERDGGGANSPGDLDRTQEDLLRQIHAVNVDMSQSFKQAVHRLAAGLAALLFSLILFGGAGILALLVYAGPERSLADGGLTSLFEQPLGGLAFALAGGGLASLIAAILQFLRAMQSFRTGASA